MNELYPEEGEQAVDIAGDGHHSPLRNCGPWERLQSQEGREAVDQDTQAYCLQAIFYTNPYVVYEGVVPAAQCEPLPNARQRTIRALQSHLAAAGVVSGMLCAAIFQETPPSYRRHQGVHDIDIPTYESLAEEAPV
jgi:hypothetical protein